MANPQTSRAPLTVQQSAPPVSRLGKLAKRWVPYRASSSMTAVASKTHAVAAVRRAKPIHQSHHALDVPDVEISPVGS